MAMPKLPAIARGLRVQGATCATGMRVAPARNACLPQTPISCSSATASGFCAMMGGVRRSGLSARTRRIRRGGRPPMSRRSRERCWENPLATSCAPAETTPRSRRLHKRTAPLLAGSEVCTACNSEPRFALGRRMSASRASDDARYWSHRGARGFHRAGILTRTAAGHTADSLLLAFVDGRAEHQFDNDDRQHQPEEDQDQPGRRDQRLDLPHGGQ